MTKGMVFSVFLGVLVVAPVSAQAAACFGPGPQGLPYLAVEVAGATGPFVSLVGEVFTPDQFIQPYWVSWPATGSAFILADGTVKFALVGAFGAVWGTLNPPGYTTGSVRATNLGGQTSQFPLSITAVACPSLPK